MSLNIIAVSYQVLCSKGLISDLKQAATCDIKNVCSLPCHRCPNVFSTIDFQKIAVIGLELGYIGIKKTEATSDFDLHLSARDIVVWLQKNNIPYRKILS